MNLQLMFPKTTGDLFPFFTVPITAGTPQEIE